MHDDRFHAFLLKANIKYLVDGLDIFRRTSSDADVLGSSFSLMHVVGKHRVGKVVTIMGPVTQDTIRTGIVQGFGLVDVVESELIFVHESIAERHLV